MRKFTTPKKHYNLRYNANDHAWSFVGTPTTRKKEIGGWIYRICLQTLQPDGSWKDTEYNLVGGTNQTLASRMYPYASKANRPNLEGEKVWDRMAQTVKGNLDWLKGEIDPLPKPEELRWVVYPMRELEPGEDFGPLEDECIEQYESHVKGFNKRRGGGGSRAHRQVKKGKEEAFTGPLSTPIKVYPIDRELKVHWTPSARSTREGKSTLYAILCQERKGKDGTWRNTNKRKIGMTDTTLTQRHSGLKKRATTAAGKTIEQAIFRAVQEERYGKDIRYVIGVQDEVPIEQAAAAEDRYIAEKKPLYNKRRGGGGGRALRATKRRRT